MPANSSPLFSLTPFIQSNYITTSNPSKSDRNGSTGTYVTICSGGNFGSRLEMIRIINSGTNTNACVRLFFDNSKPVPNPYANTGIYLFQEVVTSAVTSSSTVAGYTTEIVRVDGKPIAILPSGVLLTASCATQDPNGAYLVQAHGADF